LTAFNKIIYEKSTKFQGNRGSQGYPGEPGLTGTPGMAVGLAFLCPPADQFTELSI